MPSKIIRNRYFHRSYISKKKFREILKEFCWDSTATQTANRTGISRVTITKVFHLLREVFDTETEIDESYLEGKRVRGKRGRGVGGKIPVFGILKRGGKVYTRAVKNCSKQALLPILKGKVLTGTTVYSDGWEAYNGLVSNYDHYRIFHSHDEFTRGKNHIICY